jgi:hypothetical protein
MKQSKIFWLVTLSFSLLDTVPGQEFVNLDFEDADVPAIPADTYGPFVDPALAFPGWTVLLNGSAYPTSTFYNDLSLGGPAISLMGPDYPSAMRYYPLEGCYSVLLMYFGIGNPPALGQTGFIPYGTQSISILGDTVIEVNGVNIPLTYTSNGRSAGDISMFAGQTVQLTVTTANSVKPGGYIWDYFDDVEFSPVQIPEPSVCCLATLCIVLFYRRRIKWSNASIARPSAFAAFRRDR